MALQRAKGWVKDRVHEQGFAAPIHRLLGSVISGGTPKSVRMDDKVDIRDQQGTSSCVGQSLQQAIDVRLAIMGISTPPHSAKAIYDFARMNDRYTSTEPLVDRGCRPAQAISGLRKWGVPLERDWPFTETGINAEPPFDVLEKASAFEITGDFRISSTGARRVFEIQVALAQGFPVSFGTEVDEAFETLSDGTPVGEQGEPVGGHMMLFCGYDEQSDGTILFRGVNSWGRGWGDSGFFNANESFVTDPKLSDIYAITIGPRK